MDPIEKNMNHDWIELKSMEQITNDIIKARVKVPKDVIDILKDRSSIVGVKDNSEQLKFSSYIREAYIDVQDAFNGRTKVIMEIVASVPGVKIIFLPNESNIRKYEEDEEPEVILGGITYARSETIIIAAKGYETKEYYRKILGVIIHEFCHFAIHETFGNNFKPYYADDKEGNADKWDRLVNQYKASNLDEIQDIKELFDYDETKWVDELVVRYPQVFVEYHGSEFLNKFEEIFIDLHLIYLTRVHKEFMSEKEKIASLRLVNTSGLLGDEKSKLYMSSLHSLFDMDLNSHRQVVITNQTCLVMRNIYNNFIENYNFKSTFIFIDTTFLISDENLKMIEKALQCKKITSLIIDGHNDGFAESCARENLITLMRSNYVGKILLILHKTQSFSSETKVMHHIMQEFSASDLSDEFKGSLKVDFQGSIHKLSSLIDDVDKITSFPFDELFQEKSYETFMKEVVSIGNQQIFELSSNLEGIYHDESDGSWSELNLNDDKSLKNLFDENQVIIINCCTKQVLKLKSEIIKMCGKLKQTYPNYWIVYAESFSHFLNELCDGIPNIRDFLAKKTLRLNPIEKEIFHHFIKIGKIILLFEHNYELNEENWNSLESLFKKFEVNGNKICVFTLPTIIQFNRSRKVIKLKEMKKLEPIEDNKIPFDNELLKTLDQFSYVIQFSRKMFDLGQKFFHFHIDKENLNQEARLIKEADLMLNFKNYDQVVEKLEKSFKDTSCSKFDFDKDIRLLNLWGRILFNQGKYSEAEKKFEEENQLRLEYINIFEMTYILNKAECHFKSKKYKESVKMVDEVLKISSLSISANDQLARAFSLMGFIFHEQKLDLEAVQAFEKVIYLSKGESCKEKRKFHLINYANAYRGLKDHKKSVELIREAIKIDSETEYARKFDLYSMNLWGNLLSDENNYIEAIEKYEKAIELCTDEMIDEKKININLVAFCCISSKKYDKIIQFTKQALKFESETAIAIEQNRQSLNLLGITLIIKKKFMEAIPQFEKAFKLCTNEMIDEKKIYLNNAAICYHGLKQDDKAIAFIGKALQIESATRTANLQKIKSLNLLGSIQRDQKHYKGAIQNLEKVLEMCTDDMIEDKKLYLNNAACCYFDSKEYEKSIELSIQALEMDSNTEYALEQDLKSLNLWGINLNIQSYNMLAIEKFESAFKLCPDEMVDKKKLFLNSSADCYFKLKQYDKATRLIEQALMIKSNEESEIEQDHHSLNLWGLILLDQNYFLGAIEKLDRAFNLCTDRMNSRKKICLNYLADCCFKLKQYDKAITFIKQALIIESNAENATEQDFKSLNLWGLILLDQKKFTEAIEKCKGALEFCSDQMIDKKKICLNNIATCYYNSKIYDKAIESIEDALNIESNTEIVIEHEFYSLNLRGMILAAQNNHVGAVKILENAFKLCTDEMNDEKKICLNNLADCCHHLKQYDKAIEFTHQSLKIVLNTENAIKHNFQSLNLWGVILTGQKNYMEAIGKFEDAFKLCTDDMIDKKKIILNNLAQCYHVSKKHRKAINLIKQALKIELDTETAIEQNLQSLNLWGLILNDQKNYKEASEKFESAFKLCTNEMIDNKKIYLNNLVICRKVLKKLKEVELIKTIFKN